MRTHLANNSLISPLKQTPNLSLYHFVLHSAQFIAAREELFFMLCAATISWWDRRFACHRRLHPALWLRPYCLVGRPILAAAAFRGGLSGAQRQTRAA
jgi:hypothetical protein